MSSELPTLSATAVDALLIVFEALSESEREDAFARLAEARLQRLALGTDETSRMLRSLQAARDFVGRPPTPDDYREAKRQLADEGVELDPLSRLIDHFGSWRRAKEALDLTTVTTARRIDARFRSRRLGKVWRYREETLSETLARCVADLGHLPQVAEYEHWRERALQLARAEGNDALHLPSVTPYRKRWGTWAEALTALGYEDRDIAARLERP